MRELQNLVHCSIVTCTSNLLSARELPLHIGGQNTNNAYYAGYVLMIKPPLKENMADIEKYFMQRAIKTRGRRSFFV